jgi:hypothetical protein
MICGGGHLGFQIITKNTNLIRNHSMIIHAQNGLVWVFYADPKSKMAAYAGHSFNTVPYWKIWKKSFS